MHPPTYTYNSTTSEVDLVEGACFHFLIFLFFQTFFEIWYHKKTHYFLITHVEFYV